MDGFDFSPLFRSTIGSIVCSVWSMRQAASTAHPTATRPYNIEKTGEDAYRLTMAVAGFSPSELDVAVHENTLPGEGQDAQGG